MEPENRSAPVQSRLPWLIVAASLLLYLLTLNRWVSLNSLPIVAAVAARDLVPPSTGPLNFLVALPFRWLPPAWQAVGLNALAAVFGALTLGLLARSVTLLPHDRTRDERQREQSEFSLLSIPAAWVPPVFAALVCGLQLTFWENATAATGELLDLLLFAYVIRCLLEYRIGEDDRWLYRMALVYGIAVTNSYAMIGFFPAFLTALVWIKGRSFFEFRFVVRVMGLGVAGLLLYLLLPILNSTSGSGSVEFWPALRNQLASQKGILQYFFANRWWVVIVLLTSVVPLFVIGIRWPSSFGDTSVVGSVLTHFMFHVVHCALLIAGIFVVFDAPFGARSLIQQNVPGADEAVVTFLSFYYLGALAIGYFIGYFLLVLKRPEGPAWRKEPPATILLNQVSKFLIWAAIIAVPPGLLYKNLAAIRSNNGLLMRQFAGLIAEGLQGQRIIALSDQPHLLSLVQAYNRWAGVKSDPILADTHTLRLASYHRWLHLHYPGIWPELPSGAIPSDWIDPAYLANEMSGLAASNHVYYLHPSFGYYFERVYPVPERLVYRLVPFGTNQIAPPRIARHDLDSNAAFWKQLSPVLARLADVVGTGAKDSRALGRWYSRAVDFWGVELQRNGRLKEAGEAFALAMKLSPENISAEVNRSYNEGLQAGKPRPVDIGQNVEDRFGGRYRTWDTVLAGNGPIDEAGFCFQLGQKLAQQSLFRQAALQFIRSLELDPENLGPRFWLANVFLLGHAPDKVLETTREIRDRSGATLSASNRLELVRLDALAHVESDRFSTAEKILLSAHKEDPQSQIIADTLLQIYLQSSRLTNALAFIDQQLRQKPDNSETLLTKALVYMRIPSYDKALAALAEVLKRDPDNVRALLISGTAHGQARMYPEALAALDHVLKLQPENVEGLLTKSAMLIQTKAYPEALVLLDKTLTLQPDNQAALLNRAIASLQSGRLDDARRDYERLQRMLPGLHSIYFGLGEIAFQQKDFPAAIKHYEAYLRYAPPGTAETDEGKGVVERLKQMKSTRH